MHVHTQDFGPHVPFVRPVGSHLLRLPCKEGIFSIGLVSAGNITI